LVFGGIVTVDETRWLTADTGIVDLHFQGVPRVIASYALPTTDGLALIEVGPSTTIERLKAGIAALGHDPSDVRHILVTHIHLDHSGAAGVLIRDWPQARLYVHEVGAPHLIDPGNLVRSATRIYGDAMDTLWGEVAPVPPAHVTILTDGDVIEIGGRSLKAVYTPGHASHHVAYHDMANDVVFTGDVAGIRIPPATDAFPPTPPPDIDIPRWHRSIDIIRGLAPDRLLLTHFGPVDAPTAHLARIDYHLDDWLQHVERLDEQGMPRDDIVSWLAHYVRSQMSEAGDASLEPALELATPYGMAVDGLLRYLRKRSELV
jgi:glyoxylase-like metal-dependent hydrolase (beta-lactamase superfamily II)